MVAGAVVVGTAVCLPVTASAAVDISSPFCEATVVHDYLRPFKRMPKVRTPFKDGPWLEPEHTTLSIHPPLIAGEGRAGYEISLDQGAASVHPNWRVTTTLTRVDWRGRPVERLARFRRRVNTISYDHPFRVDFELGERRGVFLLRAVFRDHLGNRLGRFASYYRVVPARKKARLKLDARSYALGTAVRGRLENYGTVAALFDDDHRLERFDGTNWVLVWETPFPWRFSSRPDLVPAGTTSRFCATYGGPTTLTPGYYRIKQALWFAGPLRSPSERAHGDGGSRTLTAEFEVTP